MFSTIFLLVAHKQLQYTARFSRQDNPQEFLVATNARQKIRPIFAKNKAYFCKNRPYFLTGRWAAALAKKMLKTFCVPPTVAQYSSLAERQRTHPKKTQLEGNCRRNFWVGISEFDHFPPQSSAGKCSFPLHIAQFQKPLVQANGCIQYHVALQCASLARFSQRFPIYAPSL